MRIIYIILGFFIALQSSAQTAKDNGYIDNSTQLREINADGTWQEIFWSGDIFTDAPFTFTVDFPFCLYATDAFNSGDHFRVLNGTDEILVTSTPTAGFSCADNYDSCFDNPNFSSGLVMLPAGSYSLNFELLPGSFNGGRMAVLIEDKRPAFSQLGPYCVGDTPDLLPTSSEDTPPIVGTWDGPISTDAAGTTTYTFTPSDSGVSATMDILVEENRTPTFTQLGPYCMGETPDPLPTSSEDTPPIIGSWDGPITTDATGTTTYTFTSSECINPTSMDILVEDCDLMPMDISLTDPCNCENPENLILEEETLLLHDIIVVTSMIGPVTLLTPDNLLDATGSPLALGTPFTMVGPNTYELIVYTEENVLSNIVVSNGVSTEDAIVGGCAPCIEPIPTISEWGLIILSLILLSFGILALKGWVYSPLIR